MNAFSFIVLLHHHCHRRDIINGRIEFTVKTFEGKLGRKAFTEICVDVSIQRVIPRIPRRVTGIIEIHTSIDRGGIRSTGNIFQADVTINIVHQKITVHIRDLHITIIHRRRKKVDRCGYFDGEIHLIVILLIAVAIAASVSAIIPIIPPTIPLTLPVVSLALNPAKFITDPFHIYHQGIRAIQHAQLYLFFSLVKPCLGFAIDIFRNLNDNLITVVALHLHIAIDIKNHKRIVGALLFK